MLWVCIYFLFAAASVMGDWESLNGAACLDGDANVIGHCTPLSDCQTSRRDLKDFEFAICSTNDNGDLLVCCINSTKSSDVPKIPHLMDYLRGSGHGGPTANLRVSDQKCEQYTQTIKTILSDSSEKIGEDTRKTCLDPGWTGIVKGQDALPDEFPHMVEIGSIKTTVDAYKWFCGGSLIAPRYVVTVAQCLGQGQIPEPDAVRLGEYFDKKVKKNRLVVDVIKLYKHPGFKLPLLYDDIGLLELEVAVAFTKPVHAACLWNQFYFEDYTSASVSGWGDTENEARRMTSKPEKLQKMYVPLINETECDSLISQRHKTGDQWQGLRDTEMCAGYNDPDGTHACKGDTGGPLQVTFIKEDQSCHYYILGVVSFAIYGCTSRPASPGIYTRIYAYLDWIECTVWPEEVRRNSSRAVY